MIPIDKGVPFPEKIVSRGNKRYPWKELEVGDSFVLENKGAHTQAARASQKYAPRRFRVRKMDGAFRVWRVEDRPNKPLDPESVRG